MRKEEQEEETSMKDEINDAVNKWCSSLPDAHQTRIAHIAFKFRRRISSTICFLVAAYRLLARAPWTANLIAIDIKQAAMFAISKGWNLNLPTLRDFPFTTAELAVAAATYLEQIPPGVPDDPFYTMDIMLGFLPLECGKLFQLLRWPAHVALLFVWSVPLFHHSCHLDNGWVGRSCVGHCKCFPSSSGTATWLACGRLQQEWSESWLGLP